MAKILGIGIATLDIINHVSDYPAEDSEIRALKQTICRGGNVTNTLTVLSQLDHQCYWGGTLAAEPDADIIVKELNHYSIDTRYVKKHSGGKVPTSYILLNQSNGSRSIVHHRDLAEFSFQDFKIIPLHEFDWVHFEGRNIEQTCDMLKWLKSTHAAIPCSVEFEKHRPGVESLYPYADTLIFSKAYCQASPAADPELFLAGMNKSYPQKTILLSWGEKGAYAVSSNSDIIFSPAIEQPNIKDTLGAGDSFNAAVIDALLANNSLSKTLHSANKLASYKISVRGFNISQYVR
ncbi:MAG: PfkB family carbohydrate kinase [Gammaproteobacteria bacterium]|nr:PfkB family carbohydrate kinase [Gammaproteobacteria bacterium]